MKFTVITFYTFINSCISSFNFIYCDACVAGLEHKTVRQAHGVYKHMVYTSTWCIQAHGVYKT